MIWRCLNKRDKQWIAKPVEPGDFQKSPEVKFPPASNAQPSSPYPRNQKHRPVDLTYVVMKSFERLVLANLKDITGPLLDPLQFAYRTHSSVDDTINIGPNYIVNTWTNQGLMQGCCLWTSLLLSTPSSLQSKRTQLCTHLYPLIYNISHIYRSVPLSVSRSPVLELLRATFSLHCSSPFTLKTPLSSS